MNLWQPVRPLGPLGLGPGLMDATIAMQLFRTLPVWYFAYVYIYIYTYTYTLARQVASKIGDALGNFSGYIPWDDRPWEALLADAPGCGNAADLHELFDILDPCLGEVWRQRLEYGTERAAVFLERAGDGDSVFIQYSFSIHSVFSLVWLINTGWFYTILDPENRVQEPQICWAPSPISRHSQISRWLDIPSPL